MTEQTTTTKARNAGYWIGFAAKIALAVAMLLYLGLHSYNFFSFTFKGDQWIFAILGLFTTSIGFLLWLAIYLWVAEDGLQKAIAIVMMFIALFGEFAVAAFDMYMNISGNLAEMNWTAADLRNMSYIIAGLALVNGLALVADVAGMRIISDLGNAIPRRSNANVTPAPAPVVANAAETQQVTLSQPVTPTHQEAGQTAVPFRQNGH